jgi:hypothetical protein
MVRNQGAAVIQGLELISPDGKTVRNVQTSQQQLDVKGLPTGVYILLIHQTNGKKIVQRVIIR